MAQVPEALPWRCVVFFPFVVVVQVFPPSNVVHRRGGGYFGTAMSKMDASCFSAPASFFPIFGMGLDEAVFYRIYVRSASLLVTAFLGERLVNFFWDGNISVVSDTCSNAILGMKDVRHL